MISKKYIFGRHPNFLSVQGDKMGLLLCYQSRLSTEGCRLVANGTNHVIRGL